MRRNLSVSGGKVQCAECAAIIAYWHGSWAVFNVPPLTLNHLDMLWGRQNFYKTDPKKGKEPIENKGEQVGGKGKDYWPREEEE